MNYYKTTILYAILYNFKMSQRSHLSVEQCGDKCCIFPPTLCVKQKVQAFKICQMYVLIKIKGCHSDSLKKSKSLRFQNLEQTPTLVREFSILNSI